SIDALINALRQFEGTLIFISHDVYFIRALANHVVHVNAGRLTPYCGDYQYYLDKTAALSARAGLTAGSTTNASKQQRNTANGSPSPLRVDRGPSPSKHQKRLEAEHRQARSRERKAQQQV